MKNVMLALVIVFGFAAMASATDCHRQEVFLKKQVVVERHVQAPIVERVVEYYEVPQLRSRQFVVNDYGRDVIVERLEVRNKPVVRRELVREKQVVKQQVVVQKNVVKKGNFLGRFLGR